MQSITTPADTNGRIELGTVWGLMVEAGLPPKGSNAYAAGVRPGSFPVRVKPTWGNAFDIAAGGSRYFDTPQSVTLINLVPGESYSVTLFESRTEAAESGSNKTRTAWTAVPIGTAMPTAAPATGTDGYAVRPGTLGFNLYLAGAANTVTIWVRSAGGNWYATGTTLVVGTDPAVDYYDVKVPADRIYFQASAGGTTFELDFVEEQG